ncbi:hypothetical protein ACLKA7_007062 [Drosophila subpalustris]
MLTVDSSRAFEYLWYIWRILGLHPPDGNTFWARHYTAHRICVNIVVNICMPISFYIICLLSSNLLEFCETYYVAAMIAVEQMKLFNAWLMMDRFKDVQKYLNQLDRRLQSREEQDIIRDHIRRSKQTFFWIMRLFTAIIITAALLVLFTGELALQAWYPWDWRPLTFGYYCTFFCQVFGITAVCVVTISNDIYPMAYLTMIAAHFKALALRISVLGYSSDESQAVTYDKLINCIKDHQSLLLLVKTIQDTLSSVVFFQFACTASSLCTLAFYVVFVELNISKLIHMFLNFNAVIIEATVICYAAEEVYFGADQVCTAIYDCNWYSQSIKFQRTLIIMLQRSQRPVIIVASQICPVCMTTFLAVVKTAYSMFTLLIKIKSSN